MTDFVTVLRAIFRLFHAQLKLADLLLSKRGRKKQLIQGKGESESTSGRRFIDTFVSGATFSPTSIALSLSQRAPSNSISLKIGFSWTFYVPYPFFSGHTRKQPLCNLASKMGVRLRSPVSDRRYSTYKFLTFLTYST